MLPHSRQVPCPDKRELEEQMMRQLPNELNMCYVDLSTHPPYRQTASVLSFFFNATNKLQPTGYHQMFSVPHYEVGKLCLMSAPFLLCRLASFDLLIFYFLSFPSGLPPSPLDGCDILSKLYTLSSLCCYIYSVKPFSYVFF